MISILKIHGLSLLLYFFSKFMRWTKLKNLNEGSDISWQDLFCLFIVAIYVCIDSKHLCVRLLLFIMQEGINVLSLGSADGELLKHKGKPPLDEHDHSWAEQPLRVWGLGEWEAFQLSCVLCFSWNILWCLRFKLGAIIWLCYFPDKSVPPCGLESQNFCLYWKGP